MAVANVRGDVGIELARTQPRPIRLGELILYEHIIHSRSAQSLDIHPSGWYLYEYTVQRDALIVSLIVVSE